MVEGSVVCWLFGYGQSFSERINRHTFLNKFTAQLNLHAANPDFLCILFTNPGHTGATR